MQVVEAGDTIEDFELEHEWPLIGKRFLIINASRLQRLGNSDQLILFSIEDITERKSLEQQKMISSASPVMRSAHR